MRTVTLRVLREAIGVALRDALSSDAVEEFCTGIGLAPPEPPDDIAFHSKRAYVVRRLTGKPRDELVKVALQVLEECDPNLAAAHELTQLVSGLGAAGVPGELKNLIFAADGPKPEIVFTDAINNDLMVVKNEEFCLVYDRPLGPDALTWRQLGDWWADRERLAPMAERDVWSSLYRRLDRSLDNEAERRILRCYGQRYIEVGPDIPALIPQVYLHYDPYTRAHHGSGTPPLVRQRMDFLLLMPNRIRIVIECDGKQHYADSAGRADPRGYAAMMAEDRELRLRGYEVYRFGGAELEERRGQTEADVERRLAAFFDALAARHNLA